jgi:hypothetical protein
LKRSNVFGDWVTSSTDDGASLFSIPRFRRGSPARRCGCAP